MIYDSSLWLRSYDPGVSPEVEIRYDSLPECFETIRRDYGPHPAIHFLGVTLSFEQLMSQADRFARCVTDYGLCKGDVVAIDLPNSPQYLIALIGALKAGCVASGLSPLLTATEMAVQLKDSAARALVIMDALFEHRFGGVANEFTDLRLVIVTGLLDFLPRYKQVLGHWLKKVPTGKMFSLPGKEVVNFKEVMSDYPADAPVVELTQEDPCFLQYTGGTTGVPKGAVCLHRNMLANVAQFDEWLQVGKGTATFLSAFPMFHMAGLFTATVGLAFALGQVLIPNPRDTKLIVREMAKYRPRWLANVPSLYLMLLKEPGFTRLDLTGLEFCVSGAAPFPVEGIRRFESVAGEGKVIELYGMTETCVLLTCNPHTGTKKIGSVGLPLPSTKIRLVDLQTGDKDVALGEEGEIIAAGPQIMKEYHNKPGETALALREHAGELWMHTGDVGRMDQDGYLTIVDRAKDMINVGGFKVFPREVEEILSKHPAVDLCAVVGQRNPDRPETELVKLVVQKSAACGNRPEEELKRELHGFARQHVAPYKVPKIIQFREIPLTQAGKVDKKTLRCMESP